MQQRAGFGRQFGRVVSSPPLHGAPASDSTDATQAADDGGSGAWPWVIAAAGVGFGVWSWFHNKAQDERRIQLYEERMGGRRRRTTTRRKAVARY